jgi:hypothetical protein
MLLLEKVLFTSLNYWVGSFFLPQLQNWAFRLPELLKPDTKPPCTTCQAIEGGQNVPVTTCNPSWDSFSFPSEAGSWRLAAGGWCARAVAGGGSGGCPEDSEGLCCHKVHQVCGIALLMSQLGIE